MSDVFCNSCVAGCMLVVFLFFIINMKGLQNQEAKLELMKNAGEEPEGYGHAEEFAEVLEDLVDADHESDPNLNLEESEFTDIIDEDEVENANSYRTWFVLIIILFTLLILSES